MRNLPNSIKLSLIFGVAILLIGCQSAGSPASPAVPRLDQNSIHVTGQSISNAGARHFLGFWEIEISADRSSATAVPLRGPEMHFNMVHILETTCADCLKIDNLQPLPDGTISVDLTIKHPFPGLPKFTGFDVRGILVTGSDYEFPVSDRKIAWNDQNPKLLNADGYTSLFNPTDFPENPDVPFILRYTKGKYASDTVDLTATLNPFLAYSEDQPRRVFLAGTSQTQTAILRLPSGPIRFGYVVDASWFPADGDVIDPLTDFPPEANSLEAYKININSVLEIGPYAGSSVPIEVEIWDHQGPETISSVTIESPDLFNGEAALTFGAISPDNTAIYTGWVINEIGSTGYGEYPLLVRVADTQVDPNIGVVDAWQVQSVKVAGDIAWLDWTRTWGGFSNDFGGAVAVDVSGNVYVVGRFSETVDFNPGPGVDNHTSNGEFDISLSKFDSSGNTHWAKTWGGTGWDYGCGVAVDSSGNVYVTGTFWGTVDFDPTAVGEDIHTSNGDGDAFLTKFDSSGNFIWAKTWGWKGPLSDTGEGVAVDGFGNVYIIGDFMGTVDFDPGPGVDSHSSNGNQEVFMSKFDSSGNFLWAKTWGANNADVGYGIAVDGSGNLYVTGFFVYLTVDFDPGPGEDYHTSNGSSDIFLSKFDSSGNFLWARTWGGFSLDMGRRVAVDSSENVFVTGWFSDTVDFDPDLDIDNHTSNGYEDVFLSRFDSLGNLIWARTWGGSNSDWGSEFAADGSGNAYVTGRFWDTVDFNPGPGEDKHTSNGLHDVVLSRFDLSGNFQWAMTWGGSDWDEGTGVAVDGLGNAYVTGSFKDTVDFDPGPGEDIHVSNGEADAFLSKFVQ